MLLGLCLSQILLTLTKSDCFLHYPRGCNNRLNEKSATRTNANRLFDSQNNDRGGHNVCDCDTADGFEETSWMASATEMYDWRFLYGDDENSHNKLKKQYEELFFEDSYLSVTWTNQHGAANKKLLSQIVLQFACDSFERAGSAGEDGDGPEVVLNADCADEPETHCKNSLASSKKAMRAHGLRFESMNGGNTDAPDAANANNVDDIQSTYESNNENNRGRHESEEFYYLCENRKRNDGLFHADQNLKGDTQKHTRQNKDGARSGLECPEERDYYPWWSPSPWRDIAILQHDQEYCQTNIAPFSQNVHDKCSCLSATYASGTSAQDYFGSDELISQNLDRESCENAGGKWRCFSWGMHDEHPPPPECVESPWTKVNHLGNIYGNNHNGKQATYDWKLPTHDDLINKYYCHNYEMKIDRDGNNAYDNGNTQSKVDWAADEDASGVDTYNCVRMVFRIRYNISTGDYDPYLTNSKMDEDTNEEIVSAIENNPEISVGAMQQALRLAINTAQTGRTFQDRTHSFLVCEKPRSDAWAKETMYNVGVRGKRGNIVQTFPATEYDFEPQELYLQNGQCMHFQWCGSNTHQNGANGGDGQTGNDGEGRDGSDRCNLVQTMSMKESFPIAYDKNENSQIVDDFFSKVSCYYPLVGGEALSREDAQIVLGTMGFYKSVAYAERVINFVANGEANGVELDGSKSDGIVNHVLNNVSGAFRAGLVCCVNNGVVKGNEKISFSFVSTRNNNFSNRSQKLKINICSGTSCKGINKW